MSPRRKTQRRLRIPSIQKTYNNRRTSLNVNLSYVSDPSLSPNDNRVNLDNVNKTIVANSPPRIEATPRRSLTRNHTLKRSSSKLRFINESHNHNNESTEGAAGENVESKITNECSRLSHKAKIYGIRPSFVRLTSTPVTGRHGMGLYSNNMQEMFSPSENARHSNALEPVRFPLQGEILSSSATIVMETSMDITTVQGKSILDSEQPKSDITPNSHRDTNKSDSSSFFIPDTDPLTCIEKRVDTTVILDSEEQDVSINTIRTSLNVNTSLDSRFSSVPNSSLYDPINISKNQSVIHDQRNGTNATSPSSQDSDPTSSLIITTALIEHDNLSNDYNYQQIANEETVINLESPREINLPYNPSLYKRIPQNDKYCNDQNHATPVKLSKITRATNTPTTNDKENTTWSRKPIRNMQTDLLNSDAMNDSRSSDTLSLENGNHSSLHPKVNQPNAIRDLSKKAVAKGKKKLLRLNMSEMVDLSPVSTQTLPEIPLVCNRRVKIRNKTAKKIPKTKGLSKKPIASSDNDTEEIEPIPEKGKRIRKLKAKKIVINKMADIDLWKRMNENSHTINESCDSISSAIGRTSLDDFQPKNQLTQNTSSKQRPKIIIVATGLSIEQKLLVKNTVTTLGSAKLQKIVTRHTTHVISNGTRTVNLLRGLLRGCWLVSYEWISKVREAKEWVNAEKYEIVNFSKAVQENRKEKQLFRTAYVSEIFLTCGLIHIKNKTSTPASILEELVCMASGRITRKPEEAKIIVGRGGLKEVWILDSITHGEIQPLELYSKKRKPQ
ncbi:putative uncharacterized protein DDB_G0291812 [Neodiprion fabricii]|uniref:putative uncharacterized protein DDB_G0291812 n=1 Tax=Neodiprion fabricii TaxID=2872261 RepID=UPI001ED8F59E|nr:putative uncharacterized protein DDB_G0291812 [Neodiprion fabricii]